MVSKARLQQIKIGVRGLAVLGIACWFILGLLAKHVPPDVALMNGFKMAGLVIAAAILAMLVLAGPKAVFSREFWR